MAHASWSLTSTQDSDSIPGFNGFSVYENALYFAAAKTREWRGSMAVRWHHRQLVAEHPVADAHLFTVSIMPSISWRMTSEWSGALEART
jgi:hypothetical protein